MELYVWTFPLLFIFHDMEEIIGFIPWYQKNQAMLNRKYPLIGRTYESVSTEGFAFAVFEELIFCIAICLVSLAMKRYGLWLGGFIGCMLHFVVHVVQFFFIKKYVPAVITSVIALPISFLVIYKVIHILEFTIFDVLMYSAIGLACILLNLKFAHMLMKKFSIWQRIHLNDIH